MCAIARSDHVEEERHLPSIPIEFRTSERSIRCHSVFVEPLFALRRDFVKTYEPRKPIGTLLVEPSKNVPEARRISGIRCEAT